MITNAPPTDELLLLRQHIADLEERLQDHTALAVRLSRVETELRMFQALVESAIDGISFASLPDRVVRYANAAFGEMSGYGGQCPGHNMSDFVDPEGIAPVQQEIRQALASAGRWQGRLPYLRPSGEVWQAQASIFLVSDDEGAPLGQGIILRDATEQIRTEQERLALREQVIAAQRAALRELSTPLIPLADDLVVMPLIGSVDSHRAQQVIETLLGGVSAHRARIAILDITGVPVVDTQVANALLQAARALRLLGAQVVLTGIRPEVAQTLVGLGVDLRDMVTCATLQKGIAFALASHSDRPQTNVPRI